MAAVLIVEDDQMLGKMISQHFSMAGHEVFWSRNEDEVFEALAARSDVKLIFLDIMLPGTDGLHILERLKKLDSTRHIPVVMLSNLSDTEHMELAQNLGAADYIIKSNIEMSDLVEKARLKYGLN